jgi:hypothetical protein
MQEPDRDDNAEQRGNARRLAHEAAALRRIVRQTTHISPIVAPRIVGARAAARLLSVSLTHELFASEHGFPSSAGNSGRIRRAALCRARTSLAE